VSLVIFTFKKLLYELKKMKNFLFTLGVSHVPKKNLRKFSTTYRAFPTKSFFKNIPMIFCSWIIRELRSILTSIAHNSDKD